jgi:glycosyltransferase involved in cell wall biosynthesis
MKNPLISVILPVYNAEKYLKQSIDSIINQTYKDFELIIINDGSNDKSEDIILTYKDKRIVYIKNFKNVKINKALNQGIEVSKGKYISRMDADDIAVHNMFEKQIEIFNLKDEVDIVNIQSFLMTHNGVYYKKSNTNIRVCSGVHKHIVFLQNLICHPGIMIKSKLIKQYMYNENENEVPFQDVDLWYRLFKDNANCYTTKEQLLFYRNTPTSITNTKRKGRIFKRSQYIKKILSKNNFLNFNDKDLKMILGDCSHVSWIDLLHLEQNLNKYIIYIDENKSITRSEWRDLRFWKTNLIFLTSAISFKKAGIDQIFFIFIFIALRIPVWLMNKKWLRHLLELISLSGKRI